MSTGQSPSRAGAVEAGAAELLEQRLDRLRESPEYQAYLRTRDEVLRMKTAEAATDQRPSAYWREELSGMEYMLDASPLVVEKLRHHTYHVTGIRPYDYRTQASKRVELHAEKLAALRELDEHDLFVPEPRHLGGYGFDIDGDLVNIDTLKFYEVLVAMERGELLEQFRRDARRVVVEIGSGWGGFAYQFHTLFPNTSYVLVDLPELFLFAAVYLSTLFPEAKIAFWDEAEPLSASEIADYDFVFVPHTAFPTMQIEDLALAINMISFQEMTTGQVESYVRRAHELGCRYLYSLNRDRSAYNNELTSVREIMGTRFWVHDISVLPLPYTKLATREEMAERARRDAKRAPSTSLTQYRHAIGWRRTDTS